LANELCTLLQGITPDPLEAAFAERILIGLRFDVTLMVFTIAMSGAPLFTDADDVFIAWTQEIIISKCYGFEGNALQYAGYFAIHYLYEYVVLFRAGLINAFSDMEF
jgi:hypothetical protein